MADPHTPPDILKAARDVVDGHDLAPLRWPREDPWLPAVCWQVLAIHQQPKAWRARLATHEHYARIAIDALPRRALLSAVELRSIERLLDVILMDGQTSAEALYLCVLAACGLRDLIPRIADASWDTLVGAGWSIDGRRIEDVARLVRADTPGWQRDLLDVVTARTRREVDHAQASTRAFVEALATVWAKADWRRSDTDTSWLDQPHALFRLPDPAPPSRTQEAIAALVRVLIMRQQDRDLVCRQVFRWASSAAAEPHLSSGLRRMATAELDRRRWHRTSAEWRTLAHREGVDALLPQLRDLLSAGHLGDARDAAETLLAAQLRREDVGARTGWFDAWWQRSPVEQRTDGVTELARLLDERQVDTDPLSVMLGDPSTQRLLSALLRTYIELDDTRAHAAQLIRATLSQGDALSAMLPIFDTLRPSLEAYLARLEADVQARAEALADLEARLRRVQRTEAPNESAPLERNDAYIAQLMEAANEATDAPPVTATLTDSEAGWVANALNAGLEWVLSHATDTLDELLAEGQTLRDAGDVLALRQRADALATREAWWAAGFAGASTLASTAALPAAVVGATLDIAMVLSMAVRVCALQAALFGHDPRTAEGQTFILSALTSAVTGSTAQGALPWVLKSGGLAELLASHSTSHAVFARFVPLLSARLGAQITTRTLVAVVPVISAAVHGALSYRLVEHARTHAIELGTFEARAFRAERRDQGPPA